MCFPSKQNLVFWSNSLLFLQDLTFSNRAFVNAFKLNSKTFSKKAKIYTILLQVFRQSCLDQIVASQKRLLAKCFKANETVFIKRYRRCRKSKERVNTLMLTLFLGSTPSNVCLQTKQFLSR